MKSALVCRLNSWQLGELKTLARKAGRKACADLKVLDAVIDSGRLSFTDRNPSSTVMPTATRATLWQRLCIFTWANESTTVTVVIEASAEWQKKGRPGADEYTPSAITVGYKKGKTEKKVEFELMLEKTAGEG